MEQMNKTRKTSVTFSSAFIDPGCYSACEIIPTKFSELPVKTV
jgi:hypothetical protein